MPFTVIALARVFIMPNVPDPVMFNDVSAAPGFSKTIKLLFALMGLPLVSLRLRPKIRLISHSVVGADIIQCKV